MDTVRTRFAPSPTGKLHVGGLRTALYNFLYARQHKGQFLLRLEDTDQTRKVEGAEEDIQRALDWAGITPDESPWREGAVGPYIQSKRLDIYHEHADQLIRKNKAFYCFCSTERLQTLREKQKSMKQATKYDGACEHLDEKTVRQKISDGVPHVVRMKIPVDEMIVFSDAVRQRVEFNSNGIDNQILIKSDGFPTYHMANVIDDHHMRISHVIRGEEWLSSTPKHILLYRYFGWDLPIFAHLPLLLNSDRSKLSKRQGDVSVGDYIEKGYLPEAFVNFIALLGWHPSGNEELFTMPQLIQMFSLDRISKAGAVFDLQKLDSINTTYLRDLPFDQFCRLAEPSCRQAGIDTEDRETFTTIMSIVQTYADNIQTIPDAARVFYEKGPFDFTDPAFHGILTAESTPKVLRAFQEKTRTSDAFGKESFTKIIKEIQTETKIKGKWLYMPLRIALTGRLHGPEIYFFTQVFTKEKRSERIDSLLNYLDA
jgi:nondiscriminating glutamyl-tRNA synthetase